MRRLLIIPLLLILAAPVVAAEDTPWPSPAGCADYQEVKTGQPGAACDAAIATESDPRAKSTMLVRRAYIKDANSNFANYDSAIADLTEAIRLAPDNQPAYAERAFLYNDMGRWSEALSDLDRSIELNPTEPKGYQERALTRFMLGDLQGAFRDRDTKYKLLPSDVGGLLARAEAELWLGRFDDVKRDLDDADKAIQGTEGAEADFAASLRKDLVDWQTTSSSSASASDKCTDADRQGTYDRPGLIGDCTRAFLDATDAKTKAGALTIRSLAWLIARQDEGASTTDKQIAAALDPDNASWHSNLGFAYASAGHSSAAVVEFNRAIALSPDFVAYAGRASAYDNLQKYDEAAADAKRSMAMKPNEVALTVLGDIAYEKLKDEKAAKDYWLGAYRLGDRDDGLKARLAKVGVDWPPPETLLKDLGSAASGK